MKFARIALATFMLLALILRTLPDSVFDYFHDHSHLYSDAGLDQKGQTIHNFKHNCHIEDWNFEAFEVNDHSFQTFQHSFLGEYLEIQSELFCSHSSSHNGRAPPAA